MAEVKTVFKSAHFTYTLQIPCLTREYHCKNCEADFQESQRFFANRDGLQMLAKLIQQQDGKACGSLKEGGAMKEMWMKEMAGLEEKVEGWEKEMDGIEWEIEESFRNEDQG
ncbi:MAG: hypothetical protein Q9198_002603 [Flavoplaca austrocitrina]